MTTRNCSLRFMDNQMAADNGRFSVSSALAGFPGTNVLNPIRSKVWKPAGNFTVTSSNNLVYINDGSNKTVTLTAGSYTYATLAAHIQTQLNASSSNWTCSYSLTTFKFTINRTSGAATLRLTQTTNAAWDMLGYTAAADMTVDPFVAHEQRNHTDEWIKVDMVVPSEILFAGLIGPLSEAFTVSTQGSVTLYADNVDLFAGSSPLEVDLTRTDRGALGFLDEIEDTIYRYWYLKIVDRLNPLGPEGLKLGHFYIGDYQTITTSNIAQGFEKQRVDPSVIQRSESGVAYASRRTKYRQFSSMVIDNLAAADRRNLEQTYFDLGLDSSFFVSLDPTLAWSASLDEMTFYGRFSEDPRLTHIVRDYYSHSLSLVEAV